MKIDEKITPACSNALTIAVDVAKKTHHARFIDQVGRTVETPFGFQNSDEGFRRLESRFLRWQGEIGAEKAIIGMEPTGHYWKPLGHWLVAKGGAGQPDDHLTLDGEKDRLGPLVTRLAPGLWQFAPVLTFLPTHHRRTWTRI